MPVADYSCNQAIAQVRNFYSPFFVSMSHKCFFYQTTPRLGRRFEGGSCQEKTLSFLSFIASREA